MTTYKIHGIDPKTVEIEQVGGNSTLIQSCPFGEIQIEIGSAPTIKF